MNIKKRCFIEALDCIDRERELHGRGKCDYQYKDLKIIQTELYSIIQRWHDMVFKNSLELEELIVKTNVIYFVLHLKAFSSRKFRKLVSQLSFQFKPEYITESYTYSVIKALNPNWKPEVNYGS